MDVYQQVTDTIIRAIEENNGTYQMPWHRFGGQLPSNAYTGSDYNGVNVVSLWCEAQLRHFGSNQWATYKQWKDAGAQVRKSEKSSLVVFYKKYTFEVDGEEEERLALKWSYVFNADQVDGYRPPEVDENPIHRLEHVEAFVKGTGAVVSEGGGRACYLPSHDIICMPDSSRFIDTATRGRSEAFYAVLMHELCHWTGAPHRLNRDLKNRFGDEAYSAEELIAEIGSAFLCAKLNISAEVRDDHAHYCASWLQNLKNDKKYIFTASARAQEAVKFLIPT